MQAKAPEFVPGRGILHHFEVTENWKLYDEQTKVRLHELKQCKPCAYFQEKEDSCRHGDECRFCHLCPAGTLKKRKKQKEWKRKFEVKAARKALLKMEAEENGEDQAIQNILNASRYDGPRKAGLVQRLGTEHGSSDSETTQASSEAGLATSRSCDLVEGLSSEHGSSDGETTQPSSEAELMQMHFAAPPGLEFSGLRGSLAKYGLPKELVTGSDILHFNDSLHPAPDQATYTMAQTSFQNGLPWISAESACVSHYAVSQAQSYWEMGLLKDTDDGCLAL